VVPLGGTVADAVVAVVGWVAAVVGGETVGPASEPLGAVETGALVAGGTVTDASCRGPCPAFCATAKAPITRELATTKAPATAVI
jgi:hypothetical protein